MCQKSINLPPVVYCYPCYPSNSCTYKNYLFLTHNMFCFYDENLFI